MLVILDFVRFNIISYVYIAHDLINEGNMDKFELSYCFSDKQIAILKTIFYAPITKERIHKISVCEIQNNDTWYDDGELPLENGLNDPVLGELYYGTELIFKCKTCDNTKCNGHFGHFDFNQPLIHPFYLTYLIGNLSSICSLCGNKNNNKNKNCQYCENQLDKYTKDNTYHLKKNGEIISIDDVVSKKNIIKNLSSNKESIKSIDNCFIQTIPILPNSMRNLYIDNGKLQNEITKKLKKIVDINTNLEKAKNNNMPNLIIDNIHYDLQFAVNSYFNSIDYRIKKSINNEKNVIENNNSNLRNYTDFIKDSNKLYLQKKLDYISLGSGDHDLKRIVRRILENRQYKNSKYTLVSLDKIKEKNGNEGYYSLLKAEKNGVISFLIEIRIFNEKNHYKMWQINNDIKDLNDGIKYCLFLMSEILKR